MKRCRYSKCRQPFTPRFLSTEKCCSNEHAILYAREQPPKQREQTNRRIASAQKRERREALKSKSDYVREARDAFNAWVRERDFFLPCISCGVVNLTIERGGAWDAGHYRTVGAAPELRFEPLNVHKQCKSCNSGVRRQGSRVVRAHDPERAMTIRASYRVNLIERIGLDKVEWLEGPHEPRRYTVAALQEIARDSRAKTRELRARREQRAA